MHVEGADERDAALVSLIHTEVNRRSEDDLAKALDHISSKVEEMTKAKIDDWWHERQLVASIAATMPEHELWEGIDKRVEKSVASERSRAVETVTSLTGVCEDFFSQLESDRQERQT